jgi:hypothetical protein
METFVAALAVAAWLLLLIPAACVALVATGDTGLDEAISPPELAITGFASHADAAARAVA